MPEMQGLDIFYLVIMLEILGIIYSLVILTLSVSYILFVELFHIETKKQVDRKSILCRTSIIAIIGIVTLVIVLLGHKLDLMGFIPFILMLAFSLYFGRKFYKEHESNCDRINIISYSFYIFCISLILFFMLLSIFFIILLNINNFYSIFIIMIICYVLVYIGILLIIYKSYTDRDIFLFKYLVGAFLIINCFLVLPFFSETIIQKLNFGNISYEYISFKKDAKEHFPKYLSIKLDDNISHDSDTSYLEIQEDSINLYNVKALSTLGKFWYIEAEKMLVKDLR